MERIKLIVIATVIGALGLFGLRLWSGSSSVDDSSNFDDEGGRRVARQTDDTAPDTHKGMPRLGRNRGGVGSRNDTDAAGTRSGLSGRTGESRSKRSGPDIVAGEGRSTGGSVAGAAGARGKVAGSGSVVSLGGPGSGSGKDSGGRDSARSDLLNELASQPKSRGSGDFSGGGSQDLEPDVLLAVNKPEDTEDAVESRNVEAPEDGDGISFKEGTNVAFPADLVNTEAGSIAFDIQPEQWKGSDATDNSFVQIRQPNQWNDRLQIFRNGRYLRFIFTDDTSFESGISYPIDSWAPGDRKSITATWGEGNIHLYVDGQLVGQNAYQGQMRFSNNTNMHVGSDVPGGFQSAGATISNFKLYGRALSGDEVSSR